MFVPSDKMCILYVPYWMWLCLLKCMRAEKLRWGRTTNNNDQNFVTCMCYYAVLHDYIVVWRMEAISRIILVKWVNVFVCVHWGTMRIHSYRLCSYSSSLRYNECIKLEWSNFGVADVQHTTFSIHPVNTWHCLSVSRNSKMLGSILLTFCAHI